jgi:hypothetical protein
MCVQCVWDRTCVSRTRCERAGLRLKRVTEASRSLRNSTQSTSQLPGFEADTFTNEYTYRRTLNKYLRSIKLYTTGLLNVQPGDVEPEG